MKKILLLISVLTLMWGANAQQSDQADVTLTLTLHPYLHIEAIKKDVHLEYKTIANHRDGVKIKLYDHLLVHSSTKFVITAQVMHSNIADKTIHIIAERTTGSGGGNAYYNPLDLDLTSKNFIRADRGHDLKYDVTYKGKSGFGYEDITTQNLDKYTGIVRYTIIPQ